MGAKNRSGDTYTQEYQSCTELRPIFRDNMSITDKDFFAWIGTEYKRAEMVPKSESRQIRYRAKVIFDKRFPNPTYCPSCGQKEPR